MAIDYRVRPELDDADIARIVGAPYPYSRSAQLERHSLTWIGAYDGDRLVGYANVAWDGGDHAFLLDPTVDVGYRHRGIGSQLVREAIAATAAHEHVEWLHVDADEDLMNDFYAPLGFGSTPAGLVHLPDHR